MKSPEKSESISTDLTVIKETLLSLKHSPADEELIADTIKRVDGVLRFFKGLRNLLQIMWIIIAIATILLILSLIYSEHVININKELRDVKEDTLINKLLDIRTEIGSDSTTSTVYSYRVRENNQVVTYKDLTKEADSLSDLNDKLKDQLGDEKIKVELAHRNYGITFKKFLKSGTPTIRIEGKQLDSALILLDIFKGKLTYDKNANEWSVDIE